MSASWLNLVECWFPVLQRRELTRGTHRSTYALEQILRRYIAQANERPKPFVWTKTADQILEAVSCSCQRTFHSDDQSVDGGARRSRRAAGADWGFPIDLSIEVEDVPHAADEGDSIAGMHHGAFSYGLSSSFPQRPPHSFVKDRVDDVEPKEPVRHELHGIVLSLIGRVAAGQGNQENSFSLRAASGAAGHARRGGGRAIRQAWRRRSAGRHAAPFSRSPRAPRPSLGRTRPPRPVGGCGRA